MPTIDAATRARFTHLATLAGWAIAEHYRCRYDGDSNPIEHGGFFYSLADWERYDHAACVEFWDDPETGDLVVQPGTIHKPKDMTDAFRAMGWGDGDAETRDPACQVSAVRAYHGIEPDGTSYPALKSFDLDTWAEWRIWRSVHDWLAFLSAPKDDDAAAETAPVWIVRDWAGNRVWPDRTFATFDDAWEHIRTTHPDDADWEEFHVEPE